jgi:TusA-related sulfurtransferase
VIEYQLDILGKICPYCLLTVRSAMKKLSSGDILIVKIDHPPAAIDAIPHDMEKQGNKVASIKREPGVWELRITKK